MKTILPQAITTVQEAEAFLQDLIDNNEVYHPEDDAHDIIWNDCTASSSEECDQLNKLMDDIYNLEGDYDPCAYIMDKTNPYYENN
jgi:hypothetical protein